MSNLGTFLTVRELILAGYCGPAYFGGVMIGSAAVPVQKIFFGDLTLGEILFGSFCKSY